MRRLYHKILVLLNITGRDLAVFLLALLLAFSTWLIHNLSLKYTDYLTASVVARCSIEGHSAQSENYSDIIARGRTTGYQFIVSDIRTGRIPTYVDFRPETLNHMEGDLYYILSSDLFEYSHLIYGDGVSLEYFVSDTVFFRFPEVSHKKVPVQATFSVTYLPQYMADGPLEITPDSVTVYGEPYRLNSLEKVFTEPIKHDDLSNSVQGLVKLEQMPDLRYSIDDVHYKQDVIRFVEMKMNLPVKTMNVPADKRMDVYPSSVSVTMKCSFPLEENPEDGVSLYVDYEDFQNSLSGKCVVRMHDAPRGMIAYEVDPVAVNCFLEDR